MGYQYYTMAWYSSDQLKQRSPSSGMPRRIRRIYSFRQWTPLWVVSGFVLVYITLMSRLDDYLSTWSEQEQPSTHPFFSIQHRFLLVSSSPMDNKELGAALNHNNYIRTSIVNRESRRTRSLGETKRALGASQQMNQRSNQVQFPSTSNRMVFPLHGCDVGEEIPGSAYLSNQQYCRFRQFVIHADKVSFQPYGVEDINQQGTDKKQLLKYELGAFTVASDYHMSREPMKDSPQFQYIHSVLEALQVKDITSCHVGSTLSGTSYLVQRYDYTNLYYAMTDWWNTWLALESVRERQQNSVTSSVDMGKSAARVVFMDAHPSGMLDDVWRVLFQDYSRLPDLLVGTGFVETSDFEKNICLESAVLVPAGYTSELFQSHVQSDFRPDTATVEAFVHFVLQRYNLTSVRRIPGRVVLIDQRPYPAHAGNTLLLNDRLIDNLGSTVLGYLRQHFQSSQMNVTFQVVQLDNISMQEQIRSVREAHVLVGNHGAGLTHLLFMDKHSHVIEFEREFMNMFVKLASWKDGVSHTMLPRVEYTINQEYMESYLVPALDRILYKQTEKGLSDPKAMQK